MKRMNEKRSETEHVVLYTVCLVLLGLVIGLAVKTYRLENEIGEYENASPGTEEKKVSDEAETESTDSVSEAETEYVSSEQTTEAVAMTVQGDVKYVTVPASEGEADDDYNGEELRDNGCKYAIKINRQENIVTVYSLDDKGLYTVPVRAMRCSVSPDGETPLGLYNVSNKWEWLALFDNCYGQYVSQIEGDTLFHSVPYKGVSKDTLETWEFNKLGTAASMGCIRLCVADTKWIYDNCEPGTYVEIFDSDYFGPLGRPSVATKLSDTENVGWDPTDMDEDNPYAVKGAIYGAESHTISAGENYDARAGVMAFNSDREDVTEQLIVTGEVENDELGEYKVRYSFTDTDGNEVEKTIVITVIDDVPPAIIRYPESLSVENYDGNQEELANLIASHVTATDDDKIITEGVAVDASGQVMADSRGSVTELGKNVIAVEFANALTEAGTHKVKCYAVDAGGNKSTEIEIDISIVK